ncbi:uncharacterized protein PRCAT00002595001 [Priceomyces carsonii]|uniref:uncharacterized protein n=1 Tax=Priceomyces carsonii TaxID=28549 RepID=UPI002EDAED1C|nr:unnamed protein product [Priceomyces carsonii]
MSMKLKIKAFFSKSRQYVVSGASNNPSKFGFKILLWYITHDLPVIPVNPKSQEILGQTVVPKLSDIVEAAVKGQDINGYKLEGKDGLSVSFLTPPNVTSTTLKEIATVRGYKNIIKGLWFQPGSYDADVLEVAEAIGLFDKVVYEDECILVRGEEGLYSANL